VAPIFGVIFEASRPDEELTTAEVVRPELENLIILVGRPDTPVHHLRFEGLTFAHTGWTRPNRSGFVDVQANSLVPVEPASSLDPQYRHGLRKDRIPAAFEATTADDIVVQNCQFVRLGGAGVMFTHGGNDNIIEGNTFFDLSAGGIEFGEDAVRPTNPRFFPRRNRIANNFLAHIGEDYFGSVPILGYYTDSSLITHNEIAAALTAATGHEVQFLDVTPAAFAEQLRGVLPDWQVDGLLEDYAHYARGEASEVLPTVAEITGRPARDLTGFATDYADAFR